LDAGVLARLTRPSPGQGRVLENGVRAWPTLRHYYDATGQPQAHAALALTLAQGACHGLHGPLINVETPEAQRNRHTRLQRNKASCK
jgi:hypothetical protein